MPAAAPLSETLTGAVAAPLLLQPVSQHPPVDLSDFGDSDSEGDLDAAFTTGTASPLKLRPLQPAVTVQASISAPAPVPSLAVRAPLSTAEVDHAACEDSASGFSDEDAAPLLRPSTLLSPSGEQPHAAPLSTGPKLFTPASFAAVTAASTACVPQTGQDGLVPVAPRFDSKAQAWAGDEDVDWGSESDGDDDAAAAALTAAAAASASQRQREGLASTGRHFLLSQTMTGVGRVGQTHTATGPTHLTSTDAESAFRLDPFERNELDLAAAAHASLGGIFGRHKPDRPTDIVARNLQADSTLLSLLASL
jgi:hypothetical protein